MSTTLTIARREFRSSFDSPLAYVVICLALILLGFFCFFTTPLSIGFWQADRASLGQMFALTPRGLSLVVVPVLTMRLLAEEKRSGTLEMLITLPVRDHQVIMGKFLGAWGLVLVLIAATAIYPIAMFGVLPPWAVVALPVGAVLLWGLWGLVTGTLSKEPMGFFIYLIVAAVLGVLAGYKGWHLGQLDARPVLSGYLGLLLYSTASVSIGLLISALTDSQVIAFFITWFTLVVLSFMGLLVETSSNAIVRDVISFISFDARLAPFARGQIITRDVVYFLSITVGCLMAAFRALERRKWA